MKKTISLVVIIGVLMSTVILAAPGGSDDPIIVLSYLNQKINSLVQEYKLDKLSSQETEIANLKTEIEKLKNGDVSGTPSSGSSLVVVEINAGEKIIGESGTEFILRSGKAFAITSSQGGLSNVTGAVDISADGIIPSNNLIIVPRSDGRGVYTNDHAIFMVRGAYEVVK